MGPPPPPKPPSGGQEPGADASAEDLGGIVQPLAERMLAEIRRSLEYFSSQEDGVPVTRMYITGSGAKLAGLKEFLGARLNLEIVELDAFGAAKLPAAGVEDPSAYQTVYGLAVRLLSSDDAPLNLLPSDLLASLAEEAKKVWAKYAAVFGVLLLAEGSGWCYLKYAHRKQNVETLRAEYNGPVKMGSTPFLIENKPVLHKDVLERIAEVQKRRDQLDVRFQAIHELELTKYDWIAVLHGIQSVIPENAWIGDAGLSLTPTGLSLNMRTTVEDNPRIMYNNINSSPFVAWGGGGISVTVNEEKGIKIWQWSVPLKFKFHPAGAADVDDNNVPLYAKPPAIDTGAER